MLLPLLPDTSLELGKRRALWRLAVVAGGNTVEVLVLAGETTVLPARVVAAAQRGIRSALTGTPDSISDRLWAYEIEQAARVMLDQQGLAERILIHTNGDTICFTPAARS